MTLFQIATVKAINYYQSRRDKKVGKFGCLSVMFIIFRGYPGLAKLQFLSQHPFFIISSQISSSARVDGSSPNLILIAFSSSASSQPFTFCLVLFRHEKITHLYYVDKNLIFPSFLISFAGCRRPEKTTCWATRPGKVLWSILLFIAMVFHITLFGSCVIWTNDNIKH